MGQYMPEIFAVEAEVLGDSSKDEQSKNIGDSMKRDLSKKRFCGSGCSKKKCSHQGCKEEIRSSLKEVSSVERVIPKTKGGVNEVRATPVWERVRVQTPEPLTRWVQTRSQEHAR